MKIMRFVFNAISAVLGFIRKTALLIFSPIIRFLKKLSFKVKKFLQERYPKTDISGDGQVVVIEFSRYTVELVPGFKTG